MIIIQRKVASYLVQYQYTFCVGTDLNIMRYKVNGKPYYEVMSRSMFDDIHHGKAIYIMR